MISLIISCRRLKGGSQEEKKGISNNMGFPEAGQELQFSFKLHQRENSLGRTQTQGAGGVEKM